MAAPALEITIGDISSGSATIAYEQRNAETVYALISTREFPEPDAGTIKEEGVAGADGLFFFEGLKSGSVYFVYAVAWNGQQHSAVHSLSFIAKDSPPEVYPWEKERSGPRIFSDITLCPGGNTSKSPYRWDEKRFAPHVSYVDKGGREHWLFEAFLGIEGEVQGRNMVMYIGTSKTHKSADKECWQYLLDYWLGPGGCVAALDRQIAAVKERIGEPPTPRQFVLVAPDPIKYQVFTDPTSSTTYWGSISGRTLDFSFVQDRIRAYLWYMDRAREMWDELSPKNIEFAGFYILSEDLVATPDGWNYANKQWDIILEEVHEHLDNRNEGLYWIPYYMASGYNIWKRLGITMAWMQPNHYWDDAGVKNMDSSFGAMRRFGMGMELEFEYSMVLEVMKRGLKGPDAEGNMTYTVEDVPMLRERFRDYMEWYRKYGLYGVNPIALYSGSNALYQLYVSSEPEDREIYHELCQFIINSGLREK